MARPSPKVKTDIAWCRRRLMHAAWSYWHARSNVEAGEAAHAEVALRHTELIEAARFYYEAREDQLDVR